MKQIEKTEHIQLNDITLSVATCSAEIQGMVEFIDHLRQQELDLQTQTETIRLALFAAQQRLANQITTEREQAAEATPEVSNPADPQPAKKRTRKKQ